VRSALTILWGEESSFIAEKTICGATILGRSFASMGHDSDGEKEEGSSTK